MTIFTEVLGNPNKSEEWKKRLEGVEVDEIYLDQWTAQKSRFLAKGTSGTEYPVALKRGYRIADGDVVYFNPDEKKAVVLKLQLNPVLCVDLEGIANKDHDTIIRTALELGHAIGNQHWPAVVKGTKVYVPLTVDRKVMLSVLETHNIPGISYEFVDGMDVIPYLAPSETRELFGGAGHESHAHIHDDHGHIVHFHDDDHHHDHDHDHCDCHCHDHDHPHDHDHHHDH